MATLFVFAMKFSGSQKVLVNFLTHCVGGSPWRFCGSGHVVGVLWLKPAEKMPEDVGSLSNKLKNP